MGTLLTRASTGLDGFDRVIDALRTGDNVVWQVDDIAEYRYFVAPFVERALAEGRRVVYMRFAQHAPLLDLHEKIRLYSLDAHSGFESFSSQVYSIATEEGEDVFFVFDCLSDLLSAWATDLMIGNYFMIICPYLFQLNTVAYFALLRNSHSFKTVARIRETTQVLIDVYSDEANLYVHPLKVRGRHSSTMFLPHLKTGERFLPVTSSVDAARLLTHISLAGTESARRQLDYWDRLFLDVEDLLRKEGLEHEKDKVVELLCQIMIGREPRILDLAKQYFTLQDLLDIKSRLIGTGYIGGKAVGMLLARKILSRDVSFDWTHRLEPHDSFFVGSDVFYTYLVENGWWKLRMAQKTKEGYFEVARSLREQMLEGVFPDAIEEQFWRVMEYFGQSPIIIRSSSLLEDAFGNAFAGKYESIFCVNQGTPEQRFRIFREYVRRVYASTMNEDALAYRLQRGLDQHDEQMALLVQRVSGSYRNRYFFPDIGGVGISHNAFVWKRNMDPKAGMLRLVLGLGTRAVNRVENDYPRIVALDTPLMRPHAGIGDARKYSQHDSDVLNIAENRLETVPVGTILNEDKGVLTELVAESDKEASESIKARTGVQRQAWLVTFDKLLAETDFPSTMQRMLKTLETSYSYPVDIEFTTNFTTDGIFEINLVQCRPLQTKGHGKRVKIPAHIEPERLLFLAKGNFMGGSIIQPLRRVIYVDTEAYMALPQTEKYTVARLIGKTNKQIGSREVLPTLLMGPGRWGTTTPSLGVPVRFSEINNISVIVEIAYVSGSLMPELSFGTHFFQDLVETDIFYVALFPVKENVALNRPKLDRFENKILDILPEAKGYEQVLKIHDVHGPDLYLMADIVSQKVLCFTP
jgi:hypothetical protein